MNANAVQPGITQQSINGLELIVPDEKSAANFVRLVEPLFAKAKAAAGVCAAG
jgi:hypothetical protein